MPFDSLPNVETEAPLLFVERMIARLSDPKRWCKGAEFRGEQACIAGAGRLSGLHVDHQALPAVREAVRGAVMELYPRLSGGDSRVCVPRFNDHELTEHDDVMRVLQRAREILASR